MAKDWKNRIVEHGTESPEQLVANPHNMRIHPRFQRAVLRDVMHRVGWLQDVVVNKTTGNMLDGHLRVDLALEEGQESVPVKYVEITEDEEREALMTFDPIGELAVLDGEKLVEVAGTVSVESPDVRAMIEEMAAKAKQTLPWQEEEEKKEPETFEELEDELPGAQALKPDMLIKGEGTPFGIPELRPEMIPDLSATPIETWPGIDLIERGIFEDDGEKAWFWNVGNPMKNLPRERCVMSFYAEDYKFDRIWELPDVWATKIINGGFAAAVIPNFSVWFEQPKAYHIYQYYRSAWVGRYLQECGVPVVPDLKVGPDHSYRELTVAGVPKNASTVSVQMQTNVSTTDPGSILRDVRELLWAIREIEPETLLYYSSNAGRKYYEEIADDVARVGTTVVVLPSVMDQRRDHIHGPSGPGKKGGGRFK